MDLGNLSLGEAFHLDALSCQANLAFLAPESLARWLVAWALARLDLD